MKLNSLTDADIAKIERQAFSSFSSRIRHLKDSRRRHRVPLWISAGKQIVAFRGAKGDYGIGRGASEPSRIIAKSKIQSGARRQSDRLPLLETSPRPW